MNKGLTMFLAACVFAFGTSAVSAQQLKAPAKEVESTFCDICKAKDCECKWPNCVNCGGLTATPRGDASATREACEKVEGRFERGRCIVN